MPGVWVGLIGEASPVVNVSRIRVDQQPNHPKFGSIDSLGEEDEGMSLGGGQKMVLTPFLR